VARKDPRNTSRFWRAAQVPGLTCLHADFTDHDYAPHIHDALVVAITELGGAEFRSRGATGEARAARVLVFNPAEPHSGRMAASRRWRYRAFYLSEEAIAAATVSAGVDKPRYFTSNILDDGRLAETFLSLHMALEEGRDPFAASELFAGGFRALFSRSGDPPREGGAVGPDRRRLDRVTAEMRERLSESLTLDDLGADAGLTAFQLIALFKRHTGLTPHAYLTHLRIGAALARVRAGEPIARAAVAAGFYDQSAFNHHFKRTHGVTPLQYLASTGEAA